MTLEVKQMHQQRSGNYEFTLEKFKCKRMVLMHTGTARSTSTLQRRFDIYVYSQKGNCALVPNSYIHVSVSDLFIPTIGPPILLQQNRQHNRQTDRGNI
jgi:hypothetical protein